MAPSEDDRDKLRLPECWSTVYEVDRNPVRQLLVPESVGGLETVDGERWAVAPYGRWRVLGDARSESAELAIRVDNVSVAGDGSGPIAAQWVGNLVANDPSHVLQSLDGAFSFVADDPNRSRPGLRTSQLGAVHVVLGYWTTNPSQPATVVMPTGTGKTETMLALLAAALPERLLVVVPSDALRGQLAAKFERSASSNNLAWSPRRLCVRS
jgi:hypothetical protein